jgi:hypothetical protein
VGQSDKGRLREEGDGARDKGCELQEKLCELHDAVNRARCCEGPCEAHHHRAASPKHAACNLQAENMHTQLNGVEFGTLQDDQCYCGCVAFLT